MSIVKAAGDEKKGEDSRNNLRDFPPFRTIITRGFSYSQHGLWKCYAAFGAEPPGSTTAFFFGLNSHQTPSGFTAALFWLALQSCILTVNWMTNKLHNSLHFMHSSQSPLRSLQTRILLLTPGWSEHAPPSLRTVDQNHPHLPLMTQVTQVYKSPIFISCLKGERRGLLE